MTQNIRNFIDDETGAVTVDWVLLTAGLMSLTLAVMSSFGDGVEGVTNTVSTTVADRPVTTNW